MAEMVKEQPTLTDYSLIDYRPVRDLYDKLLSESQSFCPWSDQDISITQPNGQQTHAGSPCSPNTSLGLLPLKTAGVRCSCLKSKCSKNYCECFRAGQSCSSECGCCNCGNLSSPSPETSISAGGCNCRKSRCLKRYCQCHSRGQKCGPACHCVDCQNGEVDISVGPGELQVPTEKGMIDVFGL